MNLGLYFKNKYGQNHYLAHLRMFAGKFNLEYTTKGFVGIFEYDDENEIGKKSPNSIIYQYRIGENLHKFYVINFVDKDAPKAAANNKYTTSKNHKECRRSELKALPEKCRLFKEFIKAEKWLYHNELVGLCTNMINVEGGEKIFLKALNTLTDYKSYQEKSWDYYALYFKRKEYKPMSCEKFCPYCDKCNHGANMLSMVKLKYRTIEKLSNLEENYCDVDEAHQDVKNTFLDITKKNDKKIHIIYAQTAIGKTHIYVDYLKIAKKPCLICVPTNILKNEVYLRAKNLGIDIMKTPSISELNLPKNIKNHIDKLYETGQYNKVHPYIKGILQKEDIPELQEYLDELIQSREFKGHMVTTHKRLLNLQRKTLENYEIIVDEDILTTMVKNQNEISLEDLKECYETMELGSEYRNKIEEVLHKAQNEEFFSTEKLKFEYGKNIDAKIDLPRFFKAEKYYSDGKRILYFANPKLSQDHPLLLVFVLQKGGIIRLFSASLSTANTILQQKQE